MPSISKSNVIAAAADGRRIGFNRQVKVKAIRKVKQDRFPVFHIFPHYHIGGVRVEPHMRIVMEVMGTLVCQDMTEARFHSIFG